MTSWKKYLADLAESSANCLAKNWAYSVKSLAKNWKSLACLAYLKMMRKSWM